MTSKWNGITPGDRHPLRHGLAFLLCGSLSLAIDAAILKLLIALFDMHPIAARLIAISIAMVCGWLSHRTFTFALTTPPTLAEFLRYVAVGWFVSAVNYGLFVIIVLVRPDIEPLIALFLSSGVAMVFAYLGMRFAAFRAPPAATPD